MIRLLRYLKPYRLWVTAALVLILLQTLTELYLPTLMAEIVDRGIVRGDTGLILQIGGRMLIVSAAGIVCMVGAAYLSATIAAGFGRDLRGRVFAKVQSFSLHEFDRIGTASLITRTTNDITQIQMVLMMLIRMMAMAPLMYRRGSWPFQDPVLSLLLVAIPVLACAIIFIARKAAVI